MKKTKFNWACAYCGKKNIEPLAFQFDVPKRYTAIWTCGKCGKDTEISFAFDIDTVKKIKHRS